ncbi:reverse transcriptase [Gossypium australe]|uniref:Reverse transcriptase n=1 Tax=Gossypium australe TaxID=47621 RepID=A0A5B6VYK4_9ROSI|nr:reverse transcriptase [Gossypium australe]
MRRSRGMQKSITEVCSFLGQARYYRRLVKRFPTIAMPLTRLLRKNEKFYWSKECQHNFDELKKTLIEATMSSQLESIIEYVVFANASLNRLGCVLMQKGKVIAYVPCQVKPHGKNYPTHDLELTVVRHCLYREKCYIFSYHKSLKYLLIQKELNLRQQRWIELLKDYDLTIEYHLSKVNVVANALSRKIVSTLASLRARTCLANDGSILAKLRCQFKDARCNEIKEHMNSGDARNFNLGNEGELRFMGRLYVPNEEDLR